MSGQLRVGIIYTIAPYLLPQLIPALHRQAPKMPLFLKEDFTASLIPALKAGELDVIVIALPFAEPGLVAQPVYSTNRSVSLFRRIIPGCSGGMSRRTNWTGRICCFRAGQLFPRSGAGVLPASGRTRCAGAFAGRWFAGNDPLHGGERCRGGGDAKYGRRSLDRQ
jgi:hypothetical protein